MQSKNAIGNLINKYKAVLKKCALLNTFGSLALMALLTTGAVSAYADTIESATGDYSVVGTGQSTTIIGNAAGVLGTGNLSAVNGGILTLGTASSLETTSVGGKLIVSGMGPGSTNYPSIRVEYSHVDVAGGVELANNGAEVWVRQDGTLDTNIINLNGTTDTSAAPSNRLPLLKLGAMTQSDVFLGDIGGGSVQATTINLIDGNIWIGNKSTVEAQRIIGTGVSPTILVGSTFGSSAEKATLDVTTGEGLIHLSAGHLRIQNGDVIATNIVHTGNSFWVGSSNTSSLNVTDTLTLGNEVDFRVVDGTATINNLVIGNANITIGNLSSDTYSDQQKAVLTVNNSQNYDTSFFSATEYYTDQSSTAPVKTYGKINIGAEGMYNVLGSLTLNPSQNLTTAGVIAADALTINGNLTIGGGTLLSRGDVAGTHITITSGTRHELNASGGGYTTGVANAGALVLHSDGDSQLQSSVTVNGLNARLQISNGNWTAHGAITIQNGSLVVSSGSLDTSQTSLSISSQAQGNISGAKLTAKLSDFGTINIHAASGAQFTDSGAQIATDLLGNATTSLVLTGFNSTGVSISTAEYFALLNELSTDIFGFGSGVTGVTIEGLSIGVKKLDEIITSTHAPTGLVGAGPMSTHVDLVFGNIITSGTSTISAGSLTLTGLNADAGSTLTVGTLALAGGSLTLGYEGIEGKSPSQTQVSGALTATGSTSTAHVEHTHVTIHGGVDLANGSTLTIANTGGITSTKLAIDAATAQVAGKLTITGEEGITINNSGQIYVTGSTTSTNLLAQDSTVNIDGYMQLTGQEGIQANNSSITINGNAETTALHADGGSVTVGNGTSGRMQLQDISLSNGASLTIKDKGTVNYLGDYTASPNLFSAATQNNSIAVENGALFSVNGTVTFDTTTQNTLHVGGMVSAKNITIGENALQVQGGTLQAQGGTVSGGDIQLTGGIFALTSGSTEQALQSAITVNSGTSALNVHGGSWTSGKNITVVNGSLTIAQGASLTTSADFIMSGGALLVEGSLTASSNLTISGGTANISFGTLTARLEDFGTVQLNAASGAQFTEVAGKGVEIDLTTNTNSHIILTGYGTNTVLSPSEYNALLTEILKEITTDSTASLTINGINFDPNLFTLSDVAINMTQPETLIQTGDLQNGAHATFAGITASSSQSDAYISHKDAVLTLTGAGQAQGVLTSGSIEISAGTLNLGLAGISPESLSVQGSLHAQGADSHIAFAAGHTTVHNGITVENDAHLTLQSGASLSAPSLHLNKATASSAGNMYILEDTGVHLSTNSSLQIDQGLVQSSKVTLDESTLTMNGGTLDAANLTLSDSAMTVGAGSIAKLDTYSFTQSTVDVAGTLSLSGDRTLSTSDFGTGQDVFDVLAGGMLSVEGHATLDTSSANVLTTHGTISAQDIIISGQELQIDSGAIQSRGGSITGQNISLHGGSLQLTQGSGAQQLDVAVNVTSGNIEITGGAWTATKDITVAGGDFTIHGGSFKGAHVSIGSTGTLDITSGSLDMTAKTLTVATGGTVNLNAGGTLTADLANFGTVTGTTFASSSSILGNVHSQAGSNLVLQGASGNLSLTEYATLIGNTVSSLFSTQNGALTIDGIYVDTSGNTLNDITQKNMGLNQAGQSIGAGTLQADGSFVTFSHIAAVGGSANAAVKQGVLSLTGNAAQGLLSQNTLLADGGTLHLGSASLPTTAQTSVGENVIANNNGSVHVYNTHTTVGKDVRVSGDSSFHVASGAAVSTMGSTDIGTDSSTSTLRIDNEASYHANTLTLGENASIIIGDASTLATQGGSFTAQSMALNKARIFLDPAWQSGATIANASSGAIASFTNGIDGSLIMGQHSYMVLGQSSTTWAQESFARSGLTWGPSDISAALFVYSPQNIDANTGTVLVNGALTAMPTSLASGTLAFADNSLLLVNAAGLDTSKAALTFISGTGKLAVANSSKLYIENGANGDIAIVANATISDALDDGTGTNIAGAAWLTQNVDTTSALLDVSNAWYDSTSETYFVTLKQNSVASQFPLLDPSLAILLDNIIAKGPGLDVDSSHAGVRFLSRAVDNRYIGTTDAKLAAATMEGGAQVAAVGAVAQSTFNASQAMNTTILQRTSLARPVGSNMASTNNSHEPKVHNLGLWLMPLYQSSLGTNLTAGNFSTGYSSYLSGLTMGADVTTHDIFRFGMAFGLGAGQSTSTGDFNETTNDFDFWALAVYGAVNYENFGLSVDMGYAAHTNTLQQKLPQSMQLGSLQADVVSSAWTTGLRAEYLWKTKYLDITPHVGLRYTVLNTGAYDVENNGTVYNVKASNQGILTVPAGITLSKTIENSNGWTLTPRLDLGIQYATGDLEARSQTSVPSMVGSANLTMQTLDNFAFTGGLGLEVKKGNFSLGVNYNTQMAEHKSDHMLFGFARYEFGGAEESSVYLDDSEVSSDNTSEKGLMTAETQASHAQQDAPSLLGYESTSSSEAHSHDATNDTAGDAQPTLLSGDVNAQSSEDASQNGPTLLGEESTSASEAESSGSELTLLSAGTTSSNDDVHLLAAVHVRGIEISSGSYGINGDTLRSLPNASGTITGALKSMSNVQFSNAEQSAEQGGEIAPPRISIYGSKPYENNFLVDGMSVSNTLNPSGFDGSSSGGHVSGPNYLNVGGGDQDIFYDTQLIEEINIFTNNVPAKYGNFTGGVIDASLRDPKTDKWHFRIAGKSTSSSWYEVRGADSDSQTSASQPKFDIYSLSATAEGPITDSLSAMFGYSNKHSFIPLLFEDQNGEISEQTQYRLSQNFFGKLVLNATDDLTLSLDASYAPYEDLRWRESWPGSEQTLFNDALRLALQAEYSTDFGDFDFKFSYLKSGYSVEAASSLIVQDIDNDIRHGGYGSRLTDKNEFITSVDYTSPLKKNGWLTWQVESGLSVNITGVSMWAEETNTEIMVRNLGSGTSQYDQLTQAHYAETNQYNTMTKLGFYTQAELSVDRFTFTPGFRIDTDNLTNNVDISPRLKLEVDVFDNDMLRLVAGFNRYYGSALREYAFERYRAFENTQIRTYTNGTVDTVYTLGASRQYDIANLDTPYSDEVTLGLLGNIWGIDYSLDYTTREHKKQLISEEIGEQVVIYNGKSHTQSVYELTNKGFSTYEGITLTLGRSFDLNAWGKHYIGFGATVARSKTFEGSYDDDTTFDSSHGFAYETGKVYYDGALINRADLPANDYNAPLTLTLNIHSSFFEDRLRINWLNRWKADSYGIMFDERTDSATPHGTTSGSNSEESSEWLTGQGTYVQAYKEGVIKGGLISDVNIEYDVIKEEDFILGVSLDVYNIFNTETGISASDTGAKSEGTSFWLGIYTEF